ncbi:MAG: LamG domain-containing protein, partial [Candidatus Paceibacterota bacterium]
SYGSNQALSPLYNTSGLVGYWNFDEGSGTIAKDTSGNGRNGTLVNFLFSGESNWVVGKVGGGLSFNGINNYVDTSNFFDNPSSFTVALWFKVGSKHGFSNLVTKLSDWGSGAGWSAVDNYGNGEISMLYQQNGGSVYVQKGIDPAYQPTDGGWHLLGVALSSQLFTFYLDGRAVTSSDQGSVGYPSSVTNTTNVRMGTTGNFTPSSSYASGTFDDVRLYNRALSSSEMMALYNAEK